MHALKEPCIMTVQSASRLVFSCSFVSAAYCLMNGLISDFKLSCGCDFQYLFESRNDVSVLPCGHTIHEKCLKEMKEHCQFACPLCSKSVCDMSKAWERLDAELATLSNSFDDKMVRILCNDCGAVSEVQFHLIAHKCHNCKSYNTRQI
uniref:RING-type domain-containing protein n=1 Tax=Aegilops tauschii subsp. strangulata TaxID=200361 RepID=A0A453FI40_AEGTS